MPSFITHQLIAEDIYQALPDSAKSKIADFSCYYLGAQGPDPFFVYLPFTKKTENLGKLIHRQKVYGFFSSAKEYIQANDLDYSYMLGFVTHYAVDTLFHPYVYALTYELKKDLTKHKKHDNPHFLIEKDLDCFFFEEYRKGKATNYQYPITASDRACSKIYHLLSAVTWENFSVRLDREGLFNSLKRFVRHQKMTKDKYGVKRAIISGLEKALFLPNSLSYFFPRRHPDLNFTNYKREKTIYSPNGLSVFDLYEQSITLSIKLIKDFLSDKPLPENHFSTDMNTGKK